MSQSYPTNLVGIWDVDTILHSFVDKHFKFSTPCLIMQQCLWDIMFHLWLWMVVCHPGNGLTLKEWEGHWKDLQLWFLGHVFSFLWCMSGAGLGEETLGATLIDWTSNELYEIVVYYHISCLILKFCNMLTAWVLTWSYLGPVLLDCNPHNNLRWLRPRVCWKGVIGLGL